MSCEKFRKTITEALLSGQELPTSVRSHVDGCAGCRSALAREEALLATIDNGMRAAVDCEVPGSFQALVRARIREEAIPKPNCVRPWVAFAASLALLVGIVAMQNVRHSRAKPNREQPNLADNNLKSDVEPRTNTSPEGIVRPKTTRRWHRKVDPRPGTVFVAEAQPLVPLGQRQAVDQLIAGLQRGELKGEILLRQSWNGEIEDLQISPIEMPPPPATSVDEGSPGVN